MKTEEELREKYQEILEDIDENGEDLTEWEVDFISALVDVPRTRFSVKQRDILNQIHGRRVG